jgi:hypothetical protein
MVDGPPIPSARIVFGDFRTVSRISPDGPYFCDSGRRNAIRLPSASAETPALLGRLKLRFGLR